MIEGSFGRSVEVVEVLMPAHGFVGATVLCENGRMHLCNAVKIHLEHLRCCCTRSMACCSGRCVLLKCACVDTVGTRKQGDAYVCAMRRDDSHARTLACSSGLHSIKREQGLVQCKSAVDVTECRVCVPLLFETSEVGPSSAASPVSQS